MGSADAASVADQLRGIASDLESASSRCLVWAGVKASNQHCKRLASPVVYNAIKSGLVQGVKPEMGGVVAMPEHGYLNWYGLRKLLEIDSLKWIDEFDVDDAPPKRERWIQGVTWSDIQDSHEQSSEHNEPGDNPAYDEWLRREAMGVDQEADLSGIRYTDRTADELRLWHERQAMAWSSTLVTLAESISTVPCIINCVTLLQCAAIVNKSKRTLERWKTNDTSFPTPDVISENGKGDEWRWEIIKPYLETKARRKLPDVFPAHVQG